MLMHGLCNVNNASSCYYLLCRSQLRYKLNANAQKLYHETLEELKWIELEDRVSLSVANANNPLADTPARVIEEGKPEDSAELFLPGSGPAVKMFELW